MALIKKIVVLGPESTGKSTLSEQLANHYHTAWVPEYARTYLYENGMNYTYDNLLTIAKGQLASEDSYLDELERKSTSTQLPPSTQSSLLFIDTNMYVMKVWCEFVFDQCHDWILHQIARREYDLYLLCDVDLPWVKDELREYPNLESRQKLFRIYEDIMINQAVPWNEISGDYHQRFVKAVSAVDDLLAAQ